MVYLVPFLILAFPFALAYLETRDWRKTLNALSLTPLPRARQTLFFAARIFLVFIASMVLFSIALSLAGFTEPDKVREVITRQSAFALLLTVTVAPVAEELLFRSYLVPRVGVLLSSLVFSGLHWWYGSLTEMAAAFLFAVIAGADFRKNKNVYACILAHAAFNALALYFFFNT